MNASPEQVWDLVSDVTKIGRYSPETFEAEWLGDATGPAEGARFRGHVKRNEKGPVYWTECTVVACTPGREFAFAVRSRPFGLPLASRNTVQLTWSYVLTETGDGTDVTESFDLGDNLFTKLWRPLGGIMQPTRHAANPRARQGGRGKGAVVAGDVGSQTTARCSHGYDIDRGRFRHPHA